MKLFFQIFIIFLCSILSSYSQNDKTILNGSFGKEFKFSNIDYYANYYGGNGYYGGWGWGWGWGGNWNGNWGWGWDSTTKMATQLIITSPNNTQFAVYYKDSLICRDSVEANSAKTVNLPHFKVDSVLNGKTKTGVYSIVSNEIISVAVRPYAYSVKYENDTHSKTGFLPYPIFPNNSYGTSYHDVLQTCPISYLYHHDYDNIVAVDLSIIPFQDSTLIEIINYKNEKTNVLLRKNEQYIYSHFSIDSFLFFKSDYIKADKPIAVFSPHFSYEDADAPLSYGSSYQLMESPIANYAKSFVTVEFKNPDVFQSGDIIQIANSEDSTHVRIRSYDKYSKKNTKDTSFLLINKGTVWQYSSNYYNYINSIPPDSGKALRGEILIEADKPITALQLGNRVYQMSNIVSLVSEKDYNTASIFESQETGDSAQYLNLIIKGYEKGDETKDEYLGKDSEEINKEKLLSILIDGCRIDSSVVFNNIPETNLFWFTCNILAGTHRIRSINKTTKFCGYNYCNSYIDSWDSGYYLDYSFALPIPLYDDIEQDKEPVRFTTLIGDCGRTFYYLKDTIAYKINDTLFQRDYGIARIEFSENDNYIFSRDTTFQCFLPKFQFVESVKDTKKPAFTIVKIYDAAGNITIDTLRYTPDTLLANANPVNFGKRKYGKSYSIDTLNLKNLGSREMEITSLKLTKSGSPFTLVCGQTPSIYLPSGEALPYGVNFDLSTISLDTATVYTDTLEITTRCWNVIKIPIIGIGVAHRAEPTTKNIAFLSRRLKSNNIGYINVSNAGEDKLLIKSISLKNSDANFACLSCDTSATFAKELYSSGTDTSSIRLYFKYKPLIEGAAKDTIIITFQSADTKEEYPDKIYSEISGYGYLPKAELTAIDKFTEPLRIDSTNKDTSLVTIKSTSASSPLSLSKIITNYSHSYNDISVPSVPNVPQTIADSVELKLAFTASAHGDVSLTNYKRETDLAFVVDTKDGANLTIYYLNENIGGDGDVNDTLIAKIDGSVYDYLLANKADSANIASEVMACDNLSGTLKVYNDSKIIGDTLGKANLDMIVTEITSSCNNFSIQNFTQNDTIAKASNKNYNIIFTPDKKKDSTYQTTFAIRNNIKDISVNKEIRASLAESALYLDGEPSDAEIGHEQKKETISPNDKIDLGIVIGANKQSVNKLKFNIEYDLRILKYDSFSVENTTNPDWTWTFSETAKDERTAILAVEGRGQSALGESGLIVKPRFGVMLLGGGRTAETEIKDISFYELDSCAKASGDTLSIAINACVIDLRGVLIGGKYYLKAPKPNPSGKSFTITYSIAYEQTTAIELYNSLGERVAIIASGVKSGGEHSEQIDARNLSSGVYYIKMQAGTFSRTEKIIVE